MIDLKKTVPIDARPVANTISFKHNCITSVGVVLSIELQGDDVVLEVVEYSVN